MDPFSHASLSPTDFYHGHISSGQALSVANVGLPHQQVPSIPPGPGPGPGPGPRNYKSRKYRPCDFCRARQVACKIEVAPPCQLCQSHGRECTFVEQPKKKRRPNNSQNATSQNATPATNTPGSGTMVQIDPRLTTLGHDNNVGHLNTTYVPHFDEDLFERQLSHEHYLDHQHHALPATDFHRPTSGMSSGLLGRPLDSHLSRSARFIGETGECNPYLLRRYHYDEKDECTISQQTYRRIRRTPRISDMTGVKDSPPVVFMLTDDSLALKGEPRVEDHVLARARYDVSQLFTEEESLRLLGLYFRFVDPYFPILQRSEFFINGLLSREVVDSLPLSLLSALYAAAFPFILYDDLLATTAIHAPDPSNQLYRVSWLALSQELHTPRLATLQAALLHLQRAPTNQHAAETPWKAGVASWSVSLAQTLGLARDCSDWSSLLVCELAHRKRLWHAVFTMDKWVSLGAGMPSHIRADDFDVPPLWPSDCEAADDPDAEDHFRVLTELTAILSDIMDTYYSVRASQRTARDFRLSLDLGRPLRGRLKAWKDSLTAALSSRYGDGVDHRGMARLSGNPSLNLAYIVATMTLFRALLRPLENMNANEAQDHGIIGNRMGVRAGARECAKEVVVFVENLDRGVMDGFWHSWSRANFAIASSFLMQLLLTAESEGEAAEVNNLISRWRWAMRVGSGGSRSDMMSLGLLKLDGLVEGGEGVGAESVAGIMRSA